MDMLFKNLQTVTTAVCFYRVMYTFQNESIPYSCLNVKKLLA